MTRVLILGGSGEARELAEILAPEFEVISSLAGRVENPVLPLGDVRVGGFGGVDGLREWLRLNAVDAVVVATHPFAVRMAANAVAAAQQEALPALVVRRPPWHAVPGDRWLAVPSLADAALLLPGLGDRVFLTVGRQGIAAFADVDSAWFLIRAIDPPTGAVPAEYELLLERGPFTVDHEHDLIRSRRIDVLVTKNSGGAQTAAKLQAAREAGLPVVMVDRPPLPMVAAHVESVGGVADWLRSRVTR